MPIINSNNTIVNQLASNSLNTTDKTLVGGINELESGKQNTLTFDTTPALNSNNPVTSNGIKDYVDTAIANAITTTLNTPV